VSNAELNSVQVLVVLQVVITATVSYRFVRRPRCLTVPTTNKEKHAAALVLSALTRLQVFNKIKEQQSSAQQQ